MDLIANSKYELNKFLALAFSLMISLSSISKILESLLLYVIEKNV